MRQVDVTDLHHAARAVAAVERADRARFAAILCWRAHVADKHVKRLRKPHPEWGDGSLRAAALAHPQVAMGSGISGLKEEYESLLQCLIAGF